MIVSALCTTINRGSVNRVGINILGSFVHTSMSVSYIPYILDVFDCGFYSVYVSGIDIKKIDFLLRIKLIHVSINSAMVKLVVFVVKNITFATNLSHGTFEILAAFHHTKRCYH